MKYTIHNPVSTGADILGFHIHEGEYNDTITLRKGESIELPEPAARSILGVYGFLSYTGEDEEPMPSEDEIREAVALMKRIKAKQEAEAKSRAAISVKTDAENLAPPTQTKTETEKPKTKTK